MWQKATFSYLVNAEDMGNCLEFGEGKLPIRYLGAPFLTRGLRDGACWVLEDNILKRLNIWQSKFLSYAGRLTPIKSVLLNMQTFLVLPFHSSFQNCYEKLVRKFLLSEKEMKSSKEKVA